jgi:hypothetical protein
MSFVVNNEILEFVFSFGGYSAMLGLNLATTLSFYFLSIPSKRFNLRNQCS